MNDASPTGHEIFRRIVNADIDWQQKTGCRINRIYLGRDEIRALEQAPVFLLRSMTICELEEGRKGYRRKFQDIPIFEVEEPSHLFVCGPIPC